MIIIIKGGAKALVACFCAQARRHAHKGRCRIGGRASESVDLQTPDADGEIVAFLPRVHLCDRRGHCER